MSAARRIARVALALGIAFFPGCLERTLRIESDPPGARVFMDHDDVGVTPVDIPFTYGGVREFIILHEEGEIKYKPIRVLQEVETVQYDVFPFDFLVEISPFTVEDVHLLRFELEESGLYETASADFEGYKKALFRRAEELRERSRRFSTPELDVEVPESSPLPPTSQPTEMSEEPESAPAGASSPESAPSPKTP